MFETKDIGFPNFLEDEFQLEWHMSRNERYAFIKLLDKIRPKVAIEIGCFKGGSLEVLSKYADKVYTIDINPGVKEELAAKFDNVEFHIGESATIIPQLLKKIDLKNEKLEFVLIDGDHSYQGVKQDISNFLNYIPKQALYIVFHDSFNPICRKAMRKTKYALSPYIHYVELDFISGIFSPKKLFRQMWGGLALVYMSPIKRIEPLEISECQKRMFNSIYWQSVHLFSDKLQFLKPWLKRRKN